MEQWMLFIYGEYQGKRIYTEYPRAESGDY